MKYVVDITNVDWDVEDEDILDFLYDRPYYGVFEDKKCVKWFKTEKGAANWCKRNKKKYAKCTLDDLPGDDVEVLINKEVEKTKSGLPTKFENLPFEADDEDDLEERLRDWLSDQIGWLHNGFQYEIKKKGKKWNTEEQLFT